MEKDKNVILIAIGGVLSLITCAVVIFIAFAPKVVYKKDIQDWKFAPFKSEDTGIVKDFGKNGCPSLGSYPIFIKTGLVEKENNNEIKESIVKWNIIGKKAGAIGPLFVLYSEEAVKEYAKIEKTVKKLKERPDRTWPIVVDVVPYGKSKTGFGKTCEKFYMGQRYFYPETLASVTFFPPTRGFLSSPIIRICEDSYNQAIGRGKYKMGIQKNKAAQKLKEFGLVGIGMHELGHLIFGTGDPSRENSEHAPSSVGGIMAKSPTVTSLSGHMQTLLKDRVLVPCQKNGLFFTKNKK